jgi:hypothetical protein
VTCVAPYVPVRVIWDPAKSLHALLHNLGPIGILVKVTHVSQETLGQGEDVLAVTLYKGTVIHKRLKVRKPLGVWEGTEEEVFGRVRIHLRALWKLFDLDEALRKHMKGSNTYFGHRGFLKN